MPGQVNETVTNGPLSGVGGAPPAAVEQLLLLKRHNIASVSLDMPQPQQAETAAETTSVELLTPSSPPRPRAWGWGSPSAGPLLRHMGARSRRSPMPTRGLPSASPCRWVRKQQAECSHAL
jgi:hypothetical protein